MHRKNIFSQVKNFFRNIKKAFSREAKVPTPSSPQTPPMPPQAPIPPSPSKPPQESVSQLTARLQPVIDEANARWKLLDEMGLRSMAINRAYDENEDKWGFDISELTTREDIIAEATRARVFINDKTSTVLGAELYTQEESYKQYIGKFGNQYFNWENNFKKYDTSVIDEDTAKDAFAIYRRLEEVDQAMIMDYGSDKVIAMIYDVVERTPTSELEYDEVMMQTHDILENAVGRKSREFDRSFERSGDVGNILDIIEREEDDIFGTDW